MAAATLTRKSRKRGERVERKTSLNIAAERENKVLGLRVFIDLS